jgi:hypothetical protein
MRYRIKLRLLSLLLFIRHSEKKMTFDEAKDYRRITMGMARGYLHGK